MNNFQGYRFRLEPYTGSGSRYICPGCGHKNTFVRYIDIETGQQVADHVGKCDRENKCGYHYPPKQHFADKLSISRPKKTEPIISVSKAISYIPDDKFKGSLKGYNKNNFIIFLNNHFSTEIAKQVVEKYFIGTSKHWSGSTVFWQVDINGRVRTGKIMLYDALSSKRNKDPGKRITWAHKVLRLPDFNLKQCFFGEHLLKDQNKPVAIVESEKTAIISSIYFPDYIWIACGGINNLTEELCQILKGRKVMLFPDLGACEKWRDKVKKLSHITHFVVSDLLENKAAGEEKEQGLDLADYLLKFPRSENISTEKTPLEKLINKNPTLNKLIERFDLEVIKIDNNK